MISKFEFVTDTASRLVMAKKTITGYDLTLLLNANGYKSNNGTSYAYGRGVYKLIHSTYDRLTSAGRNLEADEVAKAFTNSYGRPAYL